MPKMKSILLGVAASALLVQNAAAVPIMGSGRSAVLSDITTANSLLDFSTLAGQSGRLSFIDGFLLSWSDFKADTSGWFDQGSYFNIVRVPEPSTLALSSIALLGMGVGAVVWRKRHGT